MKAAVIAIEYYLPERCLTNAQLTAEYPEWSVEKIEDKTGIAERRIAAEGECASDLGVEAALKLFKTSVCTPADIDFLLFCTQSPDYFLPTSACVMQNRLGIPTSAGALDVNLGCSGFVYGVGLAKALIENGQARNVLFVTAETYSKFIHHKDRSVRTLFGDAGAATLLSGVAGPEELIGPFVYGTDGCGAQNLIVRMGGLRHTVLSRRDEAMVECGSPVPTDANLYMNGPEIFNFTLRVVPKAVAEELSRAGKKLEDIDLFVFHQANQYMLEHLRKKLKIRSERFFIGMRHCGNTVSCTIPIALKQAADVGRLRRGDLVMLVGFGVGYSWGATLLRWI